MRENVGVLGKFAGLLFDQDLLQSSSSRKNLFFHFIFFSIFSYLIRKYPKIIFVSARTIEVSNKLQTNLKK